MSRPYGPDAFIGADHQALYGEGKFLHISDDRHLRPFGAEEYPAQLQIDRWRWSDKKTRAMSRTELVFSHPPRYHPLKDRTRHARLRIIKPLDRPEGDETQSLLCIVEEQSTDSDPPTRPLPKHHLVAKVYDPLFYSGTDVVADADMDYAHESTAYLRFQLALDKKKTPNSTLIPSFQLDFFGCWFFQAPTQDPNFAGKTRSVRLILTEYLHGLSITEMCGLNEHDVLVPMDTRGLPILDPPTRGKTDVGNTDADIAKKRISHWQRRMFIIDAVVDGLARQVHMGVQLAGCVHPDQIMIEGAFEAVANASPYSPDPAARTANEPHVVVVNYTRSITGKCTAYGALAMEELPLPCCPIDRDSNRSLAALRGWWPADWENLPKPDRTDIWPLWFQRTFNTPDYIRRTEAQPLLDKIDDAIFDVEEAEEEKLPAKYRRRETDGPEFYHHTPGGVEAFIDQCVAAQKERERLLAAERTETARREAQDPAVGLPAPVVGRQEDVPAQVTTEAMLEALNLSDRKPIHAKDKGKGISTEGQGKISPEKGPGGKQGKENRPGVTTPSGSSSRAGAVVPAWRTTAASSPYSQAQPLHQAPHPNALQNLTNRPVPSRQPDMSGAWRGGAQASGTVRGRSQAKLLDDPSQDWSSYRTPERSSPSASQFPRPEASDDWRSGRLGDSSWDARPRGGLGGGVPGQGGAGLGGGGGQRGGRGQGSIRRGRGSSGRGGPGQGGSDQNRQGGRENMPPS